MINLNSRIGLSISIPSLLIYWALVASYARYGAPSIFFIVLSLIVSAMVIVLFQPWKKDWDKKYKMAIASILTLIISLGNGFLSYGYLQNQKYKATGFILGTVIGLLVSGLTVVWQIEPWSDG